MGHMLGPKANVSIAPLLSFLLALTMEIWDPECGPFQAIFAVFAISGQVGNTISPWGKGPSQEGVALLVAYDQGLIALEFPICSSGLTGVMQLTVCATVPNFASFAVFCPVV